MRLLARETGLNLNESTHRAIRQSLKAINIDPDDNEAIREARERMKANDAA